MGCWALRRYATARCGASLQEFGSWKTNRCGPPHQQEQLAVSGICRVIVCGNLVKQSEELLGDKVGCGHGLQRMHSGGVDVSCAPRRQTLSKKELDAIAEPTKTADVMLSQARCWSWPAPLKLLVSQKTVATSWCTDNRRRGH